MILDQQRQFDGYGSFQSGMDVSKRPTLLAPDAASELENCICRGGSVRTRPGQPLRSWNILNNITYDETGHHGGANPVSTTTALTTGLFQGALYYDTAVGTDSIIASISGRLFQIVPRRTTADVTEIYLDYQNRANIPICYMVQADRFHVTQDGESTAIIFDGVNARRAGADEMPVGTIMAYGMGRIVQVGTNFRDILFGDLYGSHEGEPGESVLKFTETTFLSEGGAASIPFTMGHITGAVFYPQQDTTAGQGELLVFAEKGMASFFLSLPREQWKTSQFQRMGLIEIGGRGHRAFTPINEDIWFRSGDGWRAYRQARAEAKGWFQLPLSNEVENYVGIEPEDLLQFASSIHFDNRLIATCTPYPNQGKLYHNGFVALDFDVLSSFGQATKPAWDGHWSGLKTLQLVDGIFEGEHRAFAFGLDSNGHNALYELTIDDVQDASGPITSSLVTRSFNFQAPFNEDKILDSDTWFDSVRLSTQVEYWYKPDEYPSWIPWRTNGTVPLDPILPIQNVGNVVSNIQGIGEGFKPRRSLGKPPIASDLTTARDTRRGYSFQQKIKWVGNTAISQHRLTNDIELEKTLATP